MPDSEQSPASQQPSDSKTTMENSPLTEFVVQFWGVRGSIATPGTKTIRYGGNTSCVEMRLGGKRLIFDGGTGLRVLGLNLLRQMPVDAHMFFSHTHWDHIQGFPFFTPALSRGTAFTFTGRSPPTAVQLNIVLPTKCSTPIFPSPSR